MHVERKYAVESVMSFPLIDATTGEYYTGTAPVVGDVRVSLDGGIFVNTSHATLKLPAQIATTSGIWKLTLTAAELTAKVIILRIVDATPIKVFKDQTIIIDSYGHASAQHKFDRNSASVTLATATQASIDTLLTRMSATRAGYLDWLDIGGLVASQAEATAIQNNTRAVRVVPQAMERPDSGSTIYTLDLYLYDDAGNMEAPDDPPTVTARNHTEVDRSANLGTVTLISTGRYKVTYTVASTHAKEAMTIEWTVVEGGNTKTYGNGTMVVDDAASTFTPTDRGKLDTLHDTRLTAGRAANLDTIALDATELLSRIDVTLSTRASATVANAIQADLNNGTDGLTAIKTLLDAVKVVADAIPTTPMRGTDGANTTTPPTVAAITTALLAAVIEGTLTVQQVMMVVAAAFSGKSSGGNSATGIFRNTLDTKDRITVTMDADGNRTSITLDLT